jgi:3-oxoacyl-[acyl-carrier-protein] synthase-3
VKMAGREVFRRAVRAVVHSATATMRRSGVTAGDVAWFVPHQANARIIGAAAARLGFDAEHTVVNVDRFGNTSSASIPLALFEAVDAGLVREGDLVLCSGFGAGMTWASALIRWGAR